MSRVLGTQEVITRLHKLNQAALGVVDEKALKSLLLSRMEGRFDQGVSPDGVPWPGLLESTLKRKLRSPHAANAHRLLIRTRLLRDSLGVIEGSHKGLLASSTGAGFRLGVTDPEASRYGRFHNYGYGQETRQFIGLGASDLESVRRHIARRAKAIVGAV